jgi:hypothetical protein
MVGRILNNLIPVYLIVLILKLVFGTCSLYFCLVFLLHMSELVSYLSVLCAYLYT